MAAAAGVPFATERSAPTVSSGSTLEVAGRTEVPTFAGSSVCVDTVSMTSLLDASHLALSWLHSCKDGDEQTIRLKLSTVSTLPEAISMPTGKAEMAGDLATRC